MTAYSSLERLRLSTHAPADAAAISPPWLTDENLRAFIELYRSRRLRAVFQPILDFRARQYVAYEGLIRGPENSSLEYPDALFGLARKTGLTVEFESLCREVVLTEFACLGLAGRLFINASAAALADPAFMDGSTSRLLEKLKLRTSQIVIELTENQQVTDFSALRDVLDIYRRQGYQIAVDDLGEGFSNLRIWSEVRPDFVKIDRHFISGIADDGLKFQLVRAMHEIADTCQVHLIAEGIETDAEFATVRDIGIAYGQGFLIATPTPVPRQTPAESVLALIKRGSVIVFPRTSSPGIAAVTARKLLMEIEPVSPQCENDGVFARFEQDPALLVLPVVDSAGTPLGMINRYSLIDRFARPFRRELFGKKPCTLFMDSAPIIVDHNTSIQELGHRLSQSAQHHLLDGFLITENDRYIGIGSSQSLMALITDMQIRAARYANPLTQLPGNVPINEHIDRLLNPGVDFAACYCDLDNFKPYNDTYGYRRGDELIQFLGALLLEVADSRLDFVGHIGGDDFILILQSHDWQQRLTLALRLFDDGIADFLDQEHLREGGYRGEDRKGREVFHPLPTLSIGCILVDVNSYHSHHEVSAAVSDAKKQAKKIPGSALFIERRRR
jgi:EAL domain-containing protein (putative c-di-GMP-specific phosphodiesterase class I)/GGDEF domain-containing protein